MHGANRPTPARKRFGARVLVAEDNVVNQKVAVRMLEKLGCRVDVAANGREAIQMLEMLPYDVLFLDCQMPEMDGYEATGAIRNRQDAVRGLPIVALTANALQGERERCIDAGMDDYISKSVDMTDFETMLQRWAPGTSAELRSSGVDSPVEASLPSDDQSPERTDEALSDVENEFGKPPELDAAVITSLRELDEDGTFLIGLVEKFTEGVCQKLTVARQALAAEDAGCDRGRI